MISDLEKAKMGTAEEMLTEIIKERVSLVE